MNFDLSKILPHKAPMILIDDIAECSAEKLTAVVNIKESTFGFENGSVPSWFGIEYMAQAVAAHDSLSFSKGSKPEIGFLVGVRNYKITLNQFNLGTQIQVVVMPNFVADNSGSFDCKLFVDKAQVASALITTFKPKKEFFAQVRSEHVE